MRSTNPPTGYRAYTKRHDWVAHAQDVRAWRDPSAKWWASLPALPALDEPQQIGLRTSGSIQCAVAAGSRSGARPLITLLIDHSGSMRGRPAQIAALIAEIVGRHIEELGIPLEVLGFTTSTWRGGESRKDWLAKPWRFLSGKPGRLNDLLHIVYRGATEPNPGWPDDLTAVLTSSALKENIDGEALEWALRRADTAGYSTWICVVISDGAPVDDSTLSANGGDYLERHLHAVIAEMARKPNVRLGALGIGFNVDRYYDCAATVADPNAAGALLFQILEKLIWPSSEPGVAA